MQPAARSRKLPTALIRELESWCAARYCEPRLALPASQQRLLGVSTLDASISARVLAPGCRLYTRSTSMFLK